MDFWNQRWVDLDLRVVLSLQDPRTALFKVGQQTLDAQSLVFGSVLLQVGAATAIQFSCAERIAVAKMMQADGNLDQPLIETAVGVLAIQPKLLPHLVRLEEFAGVESAEAFQIPRIV